MVVLVVAAGAASVSAQSNMDMLLEVMVRHGIHLPNRDFERGFDEGMSPSVPVTAGSFATPLAVVCGLTYNFLPFMILPLYTSLERIDPRLHEAANDLYAKPSTTFRKVTFPLSMPGVVSGTLLTFIPAAGDYVNADLLGSTDTRMIGNVIQSQFLRILDYPTAAALSFILMFAILIMVTLYIRKSGTEDLV